MRKKKTETEEIWAFIDKDMDPKEQAQFQQRLGKDKSLNQEWLERKKLNRSLQEMEVEVPSMRFTQNLMDRIGSLIPNKVFKPLISKFWVKVFQLLGISFILALLVYLILSIWGIFQSEEPLIYPGSELVNSFINNSSYQFFLILGGLSFAYILLSFLDKYFNKESQPN